MATASPGFEAEGKESFAQDLAGMGNFFIDPPGAATRLFTKWFWVGPLLVMSITSVIASLLMSPIIQHVLEVQPIPPNVTPEQYQRGMTIGLTIQRTLMYLAPLVGACLFAIHALVLLGMSSVAGVSAKFRQLFNLVAGCWLIQVLASIAILVILKLKGEVSSTAELRPPLGLDIFLAEGTNKFLTAFLGYFSVFELWWLVMMVLIYSAAYRVSKGKAFFVVSPLIVLSLVFRLGGAAFQR